MSWMKTYLSEENIEKLIELVSIADAQDDDQVASSEEAQNIDSIDYIQIDLPDDLWSEPHKSETYRANFSNHSSTTSSWKLVG